MSLSYLGPTWRLYEITGKKTIPESNFCLRIKSLCSRRSSLDLIAQNLPSFSFTIWDLYVFSFLTL